MKRLATIAVLLCAVGCSKPEVILDGKPLGDWRAKLTGSNVGEKLAALDALGKLGEPAKDLVPELTAALKDGDKRVRENAVLALWSIGEPAAVAVPDLIALFADKVADVRVVAVGAVGKLAPPKEAVPALIGALKDGDKTVRGEAVRRLSDIGAEAKDAAAPLAALMLDRDPDVRVAAAYALGEIGPAAKVAVPALELAKKDRYKDVRSAAAHALGLINAKP